MKVSLEYVCYNIAMEELIAIGELVKKARERVVSFGKGDPYNRLRYYTKLGWLPNMTRKKNQSGATIGHYPAWALESLITIEQLKTSGVAKEEITKKLSSRSNILATFFHSPEVRKKLFIYTATGMLIFVFVSELGILPVGKSKRQIIIQTSREAPNQIIDSGTAFIPTNRKSVFVKNEKVLVNSKIYVTFNGNYSPATRFWVSQSANPEGFYVELDAPTAQDTSFSWWFTN